MSAVRYLEQIEYRRGMLKNGMVPEDLPVKVWRGTEIPTDVQKAVAEENLLNFGGVYGDEAVGSPVEYDHLKLVSAGNTVEIAVFNRGITLPFTDDERVRRIHLVLCKLDKAGVG